MTDGIGKEKEKKKKEMDPQKLKDATMSFFFCCFSFSSFFF